VKPAYPVRPFVAATRAKVGMRHKFTRQRFLEVALTSRSLTKPSPRFVDFSHKDGKYRLTEVLPFRNYRFCGASLEFRSGVFSKLALRQIPFVVRRLSGETGNDTLNANSW
jgi:hypothetical protein